MSLALFRAVFGTSWGAMGASLERFWGVLERLGGVLERLGASWGVWEGPWGVLDAFWGRLGSILGTSRGCLGGVLEASWGRLWCVFVTSLLCLEGVFGAHLKHIKGRCRASWESSSTCLGAFNDVLNRVETMFESLERFRDVIFRSTSNIPNNLKGVGGMGRSPVK